MRVGLRAGDTLLTDADGISAWPELRCWLDAQGRDKLIVTPVEHLSSLSEMADDMMANFWKVAAICFCLYTLLSTQMLLNPCNIQT